ncbi:hypothetical protein ACIU1J_10510 [Azospirillum doebereinerae]|uniref:hypothetical protein n=1 Tax=Azospirillum doebereinerae TaxID=92933 RepID=UPI00384F5B98
MRDFDAIFTDEDLSAQRHFLTPERIGAPARASMLRVDWPDGARVPARAHRPDTTGQPLGGNA